MVRFWGRLGLVLIMASSSLSAQATGPERLEGALLPGYVVGYKAGDQQRSIREEVPQGETVQRWSRMITTQRFAGLAAQIAPADFARLMIRGVAQSCPGATSTAPNELTVSGQPAVQVRIDCAALPATGKPETYFLLLVTGEQDLMARRVAFRSVPTEDDVQWAEAVLSGSVICRGGDMDPPCDRND